MSVRAATVLLVALMVANCAEEAIAPAVPSQNQPPVVSGLIPDQWLGAPGAVAEIDVAPHFHDPEGDSLTFAAQSSNPKVVTVTTDGNLAMLATHGIGGAEVTVTGRDRNGGEATVAFAVRVMEDPDREALVALYEATGGRDWRSNDNWLTDAPLGDWFGVDVNGEGRVVRVDLFTHRIPGGTLSTGNNLAGELPHELGDLTALTYLDLSGNENGLTGEIPPELGNLTALRELKLFSNSLTGEIPPELGNLIALERLTLWGNALTGPIPSNLGSLTELRRLDLGVNGLTGPIPQELGKLTALEGLSLEVNALTGTIPTELTNLVALKHLYLGRNNLSGTIPPELGNLATLEWLGLERNNLVGRIPPELGSLSALRHMDVHSNALAGEIPPELGSLTKLESLWLNQNDLTGRVPSELGNLTLLRKLDLQQTDLVGTVPAALLSLTMLRELDLTETQLCLPGTGEFRKWRGQLTSFGGETYCNEGDREVLEAVFEATGREGWIRSDGWFGRGSALEEWHGVKADSLGRVVGLSLPMNNLAGRILVSWGTLAELRTLDLSKNPLLQGPLPLSLTRVSLDTLRFRGTGLCSHAEAREWFESISVTEGTGEACPLLSDREALVALYEATGGSNWRRSDNWITDAPLGDWFGVTVNGEGHVDGLDLSYNALSGEIPPELASLTALTGLDLSRNGLTGPIPPELGKLADLRSLKLGSNRLTGKIPRQLGDLAALTHLSLGDNEVTGEIPSELGKLAALTELWSYGNDLSGRIPSELGNLAALTTLGLHGNNLTGEIPQELGDLAAIERLYFSGNALTGNIPSELGKLAALQSLSLGSNALTGEIPPELGNLTALRDLYFFDNALTGMIPPEFGNLAELRRLYLHGNNLTGPVPPEIGSLASLVWLSLSDNRGLSGALPTTLTTVRRLHEFDASNTALCAPANPEFQQWAIGVQRYRVRQCTTVAAYLVQSVQSRDYQVPLVAGRQALLRVFPTAPAGTTSAPMPPVRASFYRSGGATAVYTVDIEGKPGPLPVEVNEGDLATSANVRVPGDVVRPGLELVVEIDPEGTIDPSLGVSRRLPEEGRTALDVHELPSMELTIVPFLRIEDPDSSIIATVESLAANSRGHEMLRLPRVLLPAHEWSVAAHEPVFTDISPTWSNLLNLVGAIRRVEGGRGYWMGVRKGGGGGRAHVSGWISVSNLWGPTMAHELGHNLSLWHAPCGKPPGVDWAFPYPGGQSGAWGYDFATGRLILPESPDVMGYCSRRGSWISDYHFGNALRHRLRVEATPTAPAHALLLWGGADSTGAPYLEPAFVVDAPTMLPETRGPWTLEGRNADNQVLFSLSFAMPVIADAGEGAGSFAYTLPVRMGWQGLARITLSGPAGTDTLDGSTDRPMSIWRDNDGRVRAILQSDPVQADDTASGPNSLAGLQLSVVTSRGIPASLRYDAHPR